MYFHLDFEEIRMISIRDKNNSDSYISVELIVNIDICITLSYCLPIPNIISLNRTFKFITGT